VGDGQLVVGRAGGDRRRIAGVGAALDPAVAAARSDPGGESESRNDEREGACPFFELDSKNLSPLVASVLTQ
jgi:hypothetical protein